MTEPKLSKTAVVFESLAIRTPAQAARTKKDRDERRKSIRNQNARSKMK
jgi:hypothetical protein